MTLEELIRLKETLETSLDSLGFWMVVLSVVALLGILIEYAPEFINKLRKTKASSSLHTIIGGALIIFGVTGELFVGTKASGVETRLRSVNDSIAAIFNTEAANARRDAGLAVERAAKAESNLAEANERTAKAEIELLEIQQRLAWRELDEKASERIASKLSAFPGQKFDLVTYNDDPEALNLAGQILSALRAGEWISQLSGGWLASPFSVIGVDIWIAPSVASELRGPAVALAAALNAEGILATAEVQERMETSQKRDIPQIRVGKKP